MRIPKEAFVAVDTANRITRFGLTLPSITSEGMVKNLRKLVGSQCDAMEILSMALKEAYAEIDRLEAELLARPE